VDLKSWRKFVCLLLNSLEKNLLWNKKTDWYPNEIWEDEIGRECGRHVAE
jgi:hypothetical protein